MLEENKKPLCRFRCYACNINFASDNYKETGYRDGKKSVTCTQCGVEEKRTPMYTGQHAFCKSRTSLV